MTVDPETLEPISTGYFAYSGEDGRLYFVTPTGAVSIGLSSDYIGEHNNDADANAFAATFAVDLVRDGTRYWNLTYQRYRQYVSGAWVDQPMSGEITAAVEASQAAQSGAEAAQTGAEEARDEVQDAADKIKADELRGFPFLRWVPGNALYVGDTLGNYVFYNDGSAPFPTASALQAADDKAHAARLAATAIAQYVPGASMYFGDASGNYVAELNTQGLSGASGSGKPTIDLIIAHGQSLTNGNTGALTSWRGLAALSMFAGGVWAGRSSLGNASQAIPAGALDYLVPLESVGSETFIAACAEALHDAAGANVIAVTTGVNGQVYDNLKKGTQPYTNLLACVTAAQAFALARGAVLRVSVCWQHGEANYDAGKNTYRGYLDSLVNDLNNDVIAITGQETVHLFCGQSPSLTQSQTALAIHEKSLADSRFHLIGPLYELPLADTQHPTNIGYHYLGRKYARAMKCVLFDNLAWKPLQPISAVRSADTITVTFEGGTGALQIDTTGVSDVGNGKGFEFFDDSGSAPAVSSVTVSGLKATVTLASTPTGTQGSQYLYLAWTTPGEPAGANYSKPGARTNICDHDGLLDDSSGSPVALPNRAVICRVAVTV